MYYLIEFMLLKIDYWFNYKFLLRFLFLQKYDFIFNSLDMPFLDNLLIYFTIFELENIDDFRTINYFFLLRFFFGFVPFFTRFRNIATYNRSYYNFNIQIFLKGKSCFFPLFFLVNDLLYFTSSNYLKIFFMPLKNSCIYFFLRFFDMNLFLEKKANAGLYDLVNNINYRFYFKRSDLERCGIILELLKVF